MIDLSKWYLLFTKICASCKCTSVLSGTASNWASLYINFLISRYAKNRECFYILQGRTFQSPIYENRCTNTKTQKPKFTRPTYPRSSQSTTPTPTIPHPPTPPHHLIKHYPFPPTIPPYNTHNAPSHPSSPTTPRNQPTRSSPSARETETLTREFWFRYD